VRTGGTNRERARGLCRRSAVFVVGHDGLSGAERCSVCPC
jgi:hypothetical protein